MTKQKKKQTSVHSPKRPAKRTGKSDLQSEIEKLDDQYQNRTSSSLGREVNPNVDTPHELPQEYDEDNWP